MPRRDPFGEPLPSEVRRQLGRIKGGYRAHQLHPDLAKEAGRKGGRSYVANHPEVHASSHGRRLALSRHPPWEVTEAERILDPDK